MLGINSLNQKGYSKHIASHPLRKRWQLSPENLCISDDPYIPQSQEHHLGEEVNRNTSCPPCNLIHVIPMWPLNLQIVLKASTEITSENR